MSRFVTLDKIVKDVCVALGDTGFRQYARVIRSGAAAVDDMFRNFIPIMKSEVFEVPANLVITLPINAGIVTKVGVIRDGRIDKSVQSGHIALSIQALQPIVVAFEKPGFLESRLEPSFRIFDVG